MIPFLAPVDFEKVKEKIYSEDFNLFCFEGS